MEFSEAIEITESVLKNVGSKISKDDYDGLIVKRLESSNTLDAGRSTNQTHIAITGDQMDMFPSIHADGYFDVDYSKADSALKKYFVVQIPVYIHKDNVEYLDTNQKLFNEDERLVYVSVVRSRRNNAADQIQMSMTNIDSPLYVDYRKLVHAKTYMILLKRKQQLIYDLYSLKEEDGNDEFKELNNGFYYLPTNTPVKLDEILFGQDNKNRVRFTFEKSKESARKIVDCIYGIDTFARISKILIDSGKNIKIDQNAIGGNYLRYMFAKSSSAFYDAEQNDGKTRVFTDKEYTITIDGNSEKCRLSTEWVSKELDPASTSSNYLRALISAVNKYYSDVLRIHEESGEWYIEYLEQTFSWDKLPETFHTSFAKRYITSLLAKPFVILTGNSGTGKTRISKQFAEYLEFHSADGEKNWVLVPVGADWTDNTKVLGYYNPLADEGKGKYEKTEILKLIEHANSNPDTPHFIILDEMNLSHVERYFADFLSHMETDNMPFILDGYDGVLDYPSNLFVVGTVNIDETTYMFSPKVLDRANVIEFKPDENAVLDLFINPVKDNSVSAADNGISEAFLRLAKSVRNGKCELDEQSLLQVQSLFRQVYKITKAYGYEFAFRSVKEIRQYISAAYELLENKNDFNLISVMDEQLLQKVLPKIHGNKKEIGKLLDELETLCDTEHLTLSSDKIKQMKGKLATAQYASFI